MTTAVEMLRCFSASTDFSAETSWTVPMIQLAITTTAMITASTISPVAKEMPAAMISRMISGEANWDAMTAASDCFFPCDRTFLPSFCFCATSWEVSPFRFGFSIPCDPLLSIHIILFCPVQFCRKNYEPNQL